MSLYAALIFIVIVAAPPIIWGLVHHLYHYRYIHGVYARQDAARDWRSQFPDAMPAVDRVLTDFCEAFLLKVRYKYHLRPDDRIMEIYKNTTGPIADEMQLETLSISIESSFEVDIAEQLNEDTTLADLVDAVLTKTSSPTEGCTS